MPFRHPDGRRSDGSVVVSSELNWSSVFRDLRDRGVQALRAGDLNAALALFEQATDAARQSGDADLVDLAVCNRSAIAIELGDGPSVMPEMRAVLLRSRDAQTCMVASTNAARIHDLARDYKKGLFYARLARDHAAASGDRVADRQHPQPDREPPARRQPRRGGGARVRSGARADARGRSGVARARSRQPRLLPRAAGAAARGVRAAQRRARRAARARGAPLSDLPAHRPRLRAPRGRASGAGARSGRRKRSRWPASSRPRTRAGSRTRSICWARPPAWSATWRSRAPRSSSCSSATTRTSRSCATSCSRSTCARS